LQGKKTISAREIVELGLVKSEATLTNWRTRLIGPPFFRLSPGKYLYPVDDFLRWLDSCFVNEPPAIKDSAAPPSKEPVA
jgi:hypothetical protein